MFAGHVVSVSVWKLEWSRTQSALTGKHLRLIFGTDFSSSSDKTGRQKNPRRSGNSISSSRSINDVDMDERASPRASSASSPSDEDFALRSCCESTAPSNAAREQKELIVGTLAQIERICMEFVDDPKMEQVVDMSEMRTLADVIGQTSLVGRRTEVS
jgi:hypothetical protein